MISINATASKCTKKSSDILLTTVISVNVAKAFIENVSFHFVNGRWFYLGIVIAFAYEFIGLFQRIFELKVIEVQP